MSFGEMQYKPKVIWAYTGRGNKSHYLDAQHSGITGKRYSMCGRVIPKTGDDMSCPQSEPCECKTCNRLAEGEYWRYPK